MSRHAYLHAVSTFIALGWGGNERLGRLPCGRDRRKPWPAWLPEHKNARSSASQLSPLVVDQRRASVLIIETTFWRGAFLLDPAPALIHTHAGVQGGATVQAGLVRT